MSTVSIAANGAAEIVLRANAATEYVTLLSSGGKIRADVQATSDGSTYLSPLAGCVLAPDVESIIPLSLAEGVRQIRVMLANASDEAASVEASVK